MINWKIVERKKVGRPSRTWKDWMCTAMSERDLRKGEWNNRRQWNMEVGRRRQTFQNRAHTHTHTHTNTYIYIFRSFLPTFGSSYWSRIQRSSNYLKVEDKTSEDFKRHINGRYSIWTLVFQCVSHAWQFVTKIRTAQGKAAYHSAKIYDNVNLGMRLG